MAFTKLAKSYTNFLHPNRNVYPESVKFLLNS